MFLREAVVGVGVMSGTSLDGVDVAVVRFPAGLVRSATVLAYAEHPFPDDLRQRVREAMTRGSTADLCVLNVELGALFGSTVLATLASHPALPAPLFVACHGQTLHHAPERGATLQLGESAELLERLPSVSFVVSNFRAADVAAGGQGAPLVPFFDQWAYGNDSRSLALVNIGGIANVTLLGAGKETLAFDTGPGNVVADALCQTLLGTPCDGDGSVSGAGKVLPEVLDAMEQLGASFLKQGSGPRSTGRELFGEPFAKAILSRFGTTQRAEDLVATAVEFTAVCLWRGIVGSGRLPEAIVIAGGGARNKTLMQRLSELSGLGKRCCSQTEAAAAGLLLTPVEGLTGDNKEAVAFALLGLATLLGIPSNVPSATGARRAVVLGQVASRSHSFLASSSLVHAAAEVGFARQVDAYQRGRPSYPLEAIRAALDEVAEAQGQPIASLQIADVASGSGKLTAVLVACGAKPVAIEPSQPMREASARACPEVTHLEGTATALPLESNSQDAVFVGQAFHWFASLAALAELRRVLRPGGRLLLVWNSEAEPMEPWAKEIRDLLAPLESTVPNYRGGAWRAVWDTREAGEWFRLLPERRTRRVTSVTRQQCWERVVSKSFVASLDSAAQQRMRDDVEAILAPLFAGLAPDVTIECPLETLVFTAVKQ